MLLSNICARLLIYSRNSKGLIQLPWITPLMILLGSDKRSPTRVHCHRPDKKFYSHFSRFQVKPMDCNLQNSFAWHTESNASLSPPRDTTGRCESPIPRDITASPLLLIDILGRRIRMLGRNGVVFGSQNRGPTSAASDVIWRLNRKENLRTRIYVGFENGARLNAHNPVSSCSFPCTTNAIKH